MVKTHRARRLIVVVVLAAMAALSVVGSASAELVAGTGTGGCITGIKVGQKHDGTGICYVVN